MAGAGGVRFIMKRFVPILVPRMTAALSLLLVAGCAAQPRLGPAPTPRAAASVEAGESLPGADVGQWPGDGWWTQFGDPQLTALIEEGLASSPDVAAAAARFARARALARQAGAATLPTLDAQGSATFQKDSYNNGFPREFLPQGWQDRGSVGGLLGFDIDLWGRNRAALAAATSEQDAARVDLAQARLALAAGIAAAYADLQRLYEARDVARAAVEMRAATEDLITTRAQQGLEARGGVRLSQAQSATARAQIQAAEQDIAVRRNQLAALVGAGPDRGLKLSVPDLADPGLQGLPADVTTDLVSRRPDIVSARERVRAAASRIKVARADFFPAIRLDALVGMQALGIENVFKSGSSFGTAGPAISLPLFRGGMLQGRYRGARAEYDLAVADYDRTVLEAYRQTADAVTLRRFIARRLTEAKAAREASEDAYRMAQLRYKAGLSSYFDVLNVEDRVLQARSSVSDLAAAMRDADIQLIRALGGGFALADATNPKEMRP